MPDSDLPNALQVLGLTLFLVVHGSRTYGWRGTALFLACVYPVAFTFEALSVATGFPFGYFTHHSPGLYVLGFPLTVPLVYAVAGYVAWSVARVVIVADTGRMAGVARLAVPLVGAFVLAGYDAVIDPAGATLDGTWSFRDPSGLFGVPLTNFLGWILTGWVAFQIFAWLAPPARETGVSSVLPPIVWLAVALPSVIEYGAAPAEFVTIAGRTFAVTDLRMRNNFCGQGGARLGNPEDGADRKDPAQGPPSSDCAPTV